MKIVFSRKGFDTGSGGVPSPIIDGVPVSLPIPKSDQEPYRYSDIIHPASGSLGPIVENATNKRVMGHDPAHFDPQLPYDLGVSSLGQDGAAQSHLVNQKVTVGDLFIFFGLFKDYTALKTDPNSKPHHRIFGYMEIDRMETIGPGGAPGTWSDLGLPCPHPHTERQDMHAINAIWIGRGQLARSASPDLRLSIPDKSPSFWQAPSWLQRHGLSYHHRKDRWQQDQLQLVARGQEFVSDVGNDEEALSWAGKIKRHVASGT